MGKDELWWVEECDGHADVGGSLGARVAVCGGRVGECGYCRDRTES